MYNASGSVGLKCGQLAPGLAPAADADCLLGEVKFSGAAKPSMPHNFLSTNQISLILSPIEVIF